MNFHIRRGRDTIERIEQHFHVFVRSPSGGASQHALFSGRLILLRQNL
jgi:hypothetical protein